MFASNDMAAALGLQPLDTTSPVALIARIEDGLPVAALDRLAGAIAPDDAQFKHRLVPKATLERRRASKRLSPEEGARIARLARVWSEAVDVWGGEDEAREFLFRRHPMAEDRRLIDLVIQSEFGAELAIDILGGLRYGTAA